LIKNQVGLGEYEGEYEYSPRPTQILGIHAINWDGN